MPYLTEEEYNELEADAETQAARIAALEAALNGTATRADVIKAIDDELGSALP